MILRSSASRGYANHGWLESFHSFSFAGYYDPEHMGYSVLRVINDDKIAPNTGFSMHGHQDMEIITYMLHGELRHTDSMGNSAVIRTGDVQLMSAGTGIRHSEMNASDQSTVHLLQVWIKPERLALPPGYADKHIPYVSKRNRWALIASRDAREDSLKIHQDMSLYATVLEVGEALTMRVVTGRCAYLHIARGAIEINDQRLQAGDALQIGLTMEGVLLAKEESEVLWFDLPQFTEEYFES